MSYHPLIDSVAVALLSIVSIGFTNAAFAQRIGCFVVLSWLTWHCVVGCPAYINRSSWAALVGGHTLALLLHYLDVGVLSGWNFEQQGPVRDLAKGSLIRHTRASPTSSSAVTQKDDDSSLIPRLKFGLFVFCSWRFVDTPHQVRNVPVLGDIKMRRNRIAFLKHTGVTIAACYLILDAMNLSQDPRVVEKFFSVEKAGLFSRVYLVTLEELCMRFFAALALGLGLVSVQRGMYCILAFVCVLSGISDPEQWPPFNGCLSEACCLRKFWRCVAEEQTC